MPDWRPCAGLAACSLHMVAEQDRPTPTAASEAVAAGLRFLETIQHADGSMPSAKWRIVAGEEADLVAEQAVFPTAFIGSVLLGVPGAETIVGRATRFLEHHREPHWVWQYLTQDDPHADSLPPDVDDTALAALLLGAAGHDVTAADRVLLSNHDRTGRFFTWITVRGAWWRVPARVRILVRRRHHLRRLHVTFTVDSPRIDDIDAGVNANVVLHLGCRPGTERAVHHLVTVASRGEIADRWYQDPLTLWYLISRALSRHQVTDGAVLLERLAECTPTTQLQLAQAVCIALDWGATVSEDWVEGLLGSQSTRGGWTRVAIYADAQERWGGEATTTSLAVAALSRWLAARGDTAHDG